MTKKLFNLLITLCGFSALSILSAQQPISPLMESFKDYQQMKANTTIGTNWIQIGPTINSARADAIQVDPSKPGTMYVAFGSGNLWKTVNNGLTWRPIFEDQPAQGIGDIALAPSNSNIIYLGTGESLKKPRNFTMPGTGVYRSDDGGESWRHLGLNDSWHISEIAVHPTNPDIVLVAVLGRFWSNNKNRGLYRTEDGGKNWDQVLFVDEETGANDIVISASDPDIMYASMWQHSPEVSGKGSGVYRSNDTGQTWRKISSGMPTDENVGRIGLAVSYTNPDKVYALMDHRNRGNVEGAAKIFQSLNGGQSWQMTHEKGLPFFSVIGWYFADLYVNPQDDDEIFGLGVRLAHSNDGGKTIDYIGGDVYHLFPSAADPLHLDHCELWVNPQNPDHMALANDGGLYTTMDKGKNWTHHNNIPAGEFYDITLDKQEPYMIYGGVQDDATVYGPSREYDPRYHKEWKYVWVDAWSGGDGCVTCVDPDDPNTVYFSMQNGAARRKNMKTGRSVSIRPRLPEDHSGTLKFNFVAPYFISPHDSRTLYHGGNYIFKSTNRGSRWKVISEDLSISSVEAKKSMAVGTIAESPIKKGVLYAGTDKGAFWTSENEGKNWTEYSAGLPDNYVRSIHPSSHKLGRVYMAMTGINYDDLGNYLYVSEDHGKNWKSISGNLPNEIANVILEDPTNEDILYAGLYRGVYISIDRGQTWSLMGQNMPNVSVADLAIDEKSMDLVVGTHGRGIYKTNVKPIHEMISINKNLPYLFELPRFIRPRFRDTHRDVDFETVRKSTISVYAPKAGHSSLQIKNKDGEVVWANIWDVTEGLNEFRWDLVVKENKSDQPYFVRFKEFIKSGDYTLEFFTNGWSVTREFKVENYN